MTTQTTNSDIARLTQELRDTNDAILEKQSKGEVDVLDNIKLGRINDVLDKEIEKKHDNHRMPLAEIGEQSRHESPHYKNAFNEYLRKGTVSHALKGVNGSTYDCDRFAATASLTSGIQNHLRRYSIVRQLTESLTVTSDSFDVVSHNGDMSTAWSDGSSVATVDNNFSQKKIWTHDLTAQPKITQRTIDNSGIDVEQYIAKQLAIAFLEKETEAFINGTGSNQPFGILNNSDVSIVKSGHATNFDVEDLLSLYYQLPDRYQHDACFLLNKATVQVIRTFKDSNNQYLWMPGILSGAADSLMGVPLYTCSEIPVKGANKDVILYGNFSMGYQIVDRGGITIMRDPFTSKPFVIFFATKRVGGDVIDSKAFTKLRIAV